MSASRPPQSYDRAHYERVLEVYARLAPKVGNLAAMQEAMEAHDAERDAAAPAERGSDWCGRCRRMMDASGELVSERRAG